MSEKNNDPVAPPEISETDIIQAMKAIHGYVDITPGDFKQIYQVAYEMAVKRLLDTVTAAQLMSGNVLVVEQAMSLIQAAALLAEKQVSGAPVVDDKNKLIGVVSEKDFLEEMGFGYNPSFMQIATHCLHNKGCMIGNLHGRTVADIMTKPVISGTPEMTIDSISSIFKDQKINRLPIVDVKGGIVGIVTRTDVARAYHVFAERSQK